MLITRSVMKSGTCVLFLIRRFVKETMNPATDPKQLLVIGWRWPPAQQPPWQHSTPLMASWENVLSSLCWNWRHHPGLFGLANLPASRCASVWSDAAKHSGQRGPDWQNYNPQAERKREAIWVSNAADQMVQSASGLQVLAQRPCCGPAHTWSSLHTPHFFPPSHSCSSAAVCFSPH